MKKLLFISLFAALLAVGCSKEDIGGGNGDGPNIPTYEIWYTSSDGEIVNPYSGEYAIEYPFGEGVEIISNTYENDKGIIKFNAPVTTIGERAFYYCSSLTKITIPDSVTTIGSSAFGHCSSLTKITIPDSVTTIGSSAFGYCSSLTKITIPDSVAEIGGSAFTNCSSLTAFYGKFASSDNRCLIVDGVLYSFAPAGLTEYTIPDSVTEIGIWAFSGYSSLTSITIPDSVTTIGRYAFYSCRSLTSVTIGKSVTTIGERAFSGYSRLTTVTIPDSVTEIGYGAFEYCSSLTAFYGKFASSDNRCLIVDGVLYSFAPAGLTEYAIPDSVTTIYGAFGYCSSLTSVAIPDSVTEIGVGAFSFCRSLTSVTIGKSVTEISSGAFEYCSSLTSITIPDSVTTIGNFAFYDCISLTSVYCRATTPPILYSSVYYNLPADAKIYVPRESVEAYKAAENWSKYADLIQPYDFE